MGRIDKETAFSFRQDEVDVKADLYPRSRSYAVRRRNVGFAQERGVRGIEPMFSLIQPIVYFFFHCQSLFRNEIYGAKVNLNFPEPDYIIFFCIDSLKWKSTTKKKGWTLS